MDAKHRVGLRIRAIRKRRNLSQDALAELIDRSSEAVSNLERGLSTPSFDTLEALSVALGVPISELVAEAQTENKARVENLARMADAARDLDDQTLATATEIVEVLAKNRPR